MFLKFSLSFIFTLTVLTKSSFAWEKRCKHYDRSDRCTQQVMLATAAEINPLKNQLNALNLRVDREIARVKKEKIELERLNPEVADFIKDKTVDEILIKLKALLAEHGLEVNDEDF